MKYILIALSFISSNLYAQNIKLYGNEFRIIKTYPAKIGYLATVTTDTVGYFDSLKLDMRKPVLFARWTTSGRPASPIAGMFGYNTDSARVEWYDGAAWQQPSASSGASVTSVSNSDGSLTISPTTGAVVGSLNVGHSNTWSANQLFNSGTFKLKDADGSNTCTFALGTNYAFDRTITWTFGDVNRTITMNGTVTFPNNFIVTGNFAAGLTFTNTTSATFPSGTITLADIASSQSFTNKTLTSSTNTLGGVTTTGLNKITSPLNVLTRDADSLLKSTTLADLLAALGVESNTYTATLTNGANVASSSFTEAYYMKIGNIVYVYGTIDVDATTALTLTNIDISLPIASDIAAGTNISGNIISSTSADNAYGTIAGSVANDRATCAFVFGATGGNATFRFNFMYRIL